MQEAQKGIEFDPDFAFGYSNIAADYISLGSLERAKNSLQRATKRKLQ